MFIPLSTFSEKRALKFEDMFKAGRLGSLSLSADSSRVVFQVKTPDLKNNKYKTDIYFTDLVTGKIKKLTNSEETIWLRNSGLKMRSHLSPPEMGTSIIYNEYNRWEGT